MTIPCLCRCNCAFNVVLRDSCNDKVVVMKYYELLSHLRAPRCLSVSRSFLDIKIYGIWTYARFDYDGKIRIVDRTVVSRYRALEELLQDRKIRRSTGLQNYLDSHSNNHPYQ